MSNYNFDNFICVLTNLAKTLDNQEMEIIRYYIQKSNEQKSNTPTITYEELRGISLLKEKTNEEIQRIMDSALSKYIDLGKIFKQTYQDLENADDQIYEKLSTTKLKIDEAIILNEILNKTTDKIQQQKKKLIEDVIEKQNITNDEFQASCKNIFEKLMK